MDAFTVSIDVPVEHMRNLFGEFDSHIKRIENDLHVMIVDRDGAVRISGKRDAADRAARIVKELLALSERGAILEEQSVDYAIELGREHKEDMLLAMDSDCICHTVSGKPIKPKTLGQKQYVDAMRDHMIVFGVGPAGTGKTYLAMAMAVTAFKNNEVSRIILTRPAIEAGEKLGFLPGDLQSKVDPYLRPLYDALYQIMGAESFARNMEKGLIEVAPLAYMRGRTLDNAYIILDEAQNTTPAQMKMFLTRIGFGSKVVVTGDASQKDLAPDMKSGLDVAVRVLSKIDDISFCSLSSKDVVRHPLVQRIVKAYDDYEEKEKRRSGKKQETGITGVENNINLEKNSNIIKRIVVFMFMFALSGVIAWLGSVLYHIQTDMMIRNIVMVLTGSGIVIFSYVMGETSGFFVYRNEGRYGRFAFIYLVSLTAAVFLPFLPVTGWPFLVLFVLLSVFSNSMTGLAAGSLGLLLAVNFAGCDYAIFWLYFVSGMAGILVFATLDEDFRVGIPMVISLLVLSLCLTANVILFAKEQLSIAQFMIPGINLMVCCILLLVSLKMVSSMVIHRYRDRYMEINDPECPLLVQLKELSKEEYYHAIHTAYLGDKVARSLGIDDAAVKACGYYHRIGKLTGENTWENVSAICDKYHFPPKTKQILKEYVDPDAKIVSKETIVVLLADCIVSSILYLFAKDPKAELDYEQLIDTVFKKKFETDELWGNEISIGQICEMKKIFIKEKLYYDFLR